MDTTESYCNLTNHFLIAMPGLREGIFANSVTYICEHTREGAMGIIINHPLELSLDDIFLHLKIKDFTETHQQPVMAGGPVQMDRGFVLHPRSGKRWESTLDISDDISLSTSTDILNAIAHDQGPQNSLVALGYAGWGADQLEEELAANSWLTLPAESSIIFETPIEQRAQAAARRLGFDLSSLSAHAGHA